LEKKNRKKLTVKEIEFMDKFIASRSKIVDVKEREDGPVTRYKHLIDVNFVMNTFKKAYSSPINKYVQMSSDVTKYVLVCIYCEL
jgi:hypothetical protein